MSDQAALSVAISCGDHRPLSGILRGPGPAPATSRPVILAHSAGGSMREPVLAHIATAIADAGHPCLVFNFPYAEQGKRMPDRAPALQAAWRSAAAWMRERFPDRPPVVGGRSMGGRMATHAVADLTVKAHGIVLLGYPLHPPRRADVLRDAHLPRIPVPTLFVQGTRDQYAEAALLDAAIARMRAAGCAVELHRIEGADHSYRVPARQGRPHDDVLDEVAETCVAWLRITG